MEKRVSKTRPRLPDKRHECWTAAGRQNEGLNARGNGWLKKQRANAATAAAPWLDKARSEINRIQHASAPRGEPGPRWRRWQQTSPGCTDPWVHWPMVRVLCHAIQSADAKAKWCCAHLPGVILSKLGMPRCVGPCLAAGASCQFQCGCSYPEETLAGDKRLAGATVLFLVLPVSSCLCVSILRYLSPPPHQTHLCSTSRSFSYRRLHAVAQRDSRAA